MNTQKSRRKYNKKNIALIVLIIIMLEANANLVLGINTIHENGIKADLFRIMSLKSLTSTFITYTTDFFSKDPILQAAPYTSKPFFLRIRASTRLSSRRPTQVAIPSLWNPILFANSTSS